MTLSTTFSEQLSIACQQILQQDGSVFSIQCLELPPPLTTGLTAEILLQKYLRHIRRITGTLVQPRQQGNTVAFQLWRSRIILLGFTLGQADAHHLEMHINGGILVQPAYRQQGSLLLRCEPRDDRVFLELCLSGYHPRLLGGPAPGLIRKWFYRLTQATIHKFVTVRFLVHLVREQTGKNVDYRVVRAQIRDGEPI